MRFEDQPPLTCFPIGRVRSPYVEKMMAPRQGSLCKGVLSQIILFDDPRLEHALHGIEEWSHLWVVFWFDRDPRFSPKVQPPRSAQRRGVLSTRSPHRPNPIGLTAARLLRREGKTLWLDGLDLLDDTCVLDLKPYVPYADRLEEANDGWLEVDGAGSWELGWSVEILAQIAFLEDHHIELRRRLEQILEAGPFAHSSRRIRREGSRGILALKDYRICFEVVDRRIELARIESGYTELPHSLGDNATDSSSLEVHRAFVSSFGRRDPEEWLKNSG
jgi:tRNA-Thr(GGU) m(6)t(6)A37 methyltransferase TsaA